MGTFNQLLGEFAGLADTGEREPWLVKNLTESIANISTVRGGRNVILYGSGFLQKPNVPAGHTSISLEDINGLMAVMHGMDWSKGLTLVLHTNGGVVAATESIVSYLRGKFSDVEVIVPTFAMSAGTMISLASSNIYLGRHSQLGPIDAQMPYAGGRSYSARAIVDQFESAQADMAEHGNIEAWGPILAAQGPSLLQEAKNALDYSEEIVAKWVSNYMFPDLPGSTAKGAAIAKFFNDGTTHKSHGRRIGYEEAADAGVSVTRLEDDQPLQEAVLTAYHVMTIAFEHTMLTKVIWSNSGASWAKRWIGAVRARD